MFELVHGPIDETAARAAVAHPGAGAMLVFAGTARDTFEGKAVVALFYEAYAEMAVPVMRQIGEELTSRFEGARVAMVHRLGPVAIGEVSVVIVTSAPHRSACYAASRYAIDELKQRVPIWKKEMYQDGSGWKANY